MTKSQKKARFLEIRKHLGMSQRDIAEYLQRSRSCVIKWENDMREIPEMVIEYLELKLANEPPNDKV
jgi:DNA-binding transcriptional regulator YiaG